MKLLAWLLLAGLALWMFYNDAAAPLEASHTLVSQLGADYLWPDLEAGGDQRITYWTCASNPPGQWGYAVEVKWDDPLTTWGFDAVLDCNAQTVLAWEGSSFGFCDPAFIACWVRVQNVPHTDHVDNQRTRILFDVDSANPYNTFGTNWKTAIAAHEWGHNMDLADHLDIGQCAAGTLMGQVDLDRKASDNPCYTGPTPGDLSSVLCVYIRVCHTPGVWRSGEWHLRYSNSSGAGDLSFTYGNPTDVPLAGDWDRDGDDTAGVYRPSTRQFFLSNNNSTAAISVAYGNSGDLPLAGDWDGDGDDTIGVYRPSTAQFFLSNNNATTAISVAYGNGGDLPIVGDWDGDGDDTIGVYRPSTTEFHLSNNNSTAAVSVIYGNVGDTPIVGDWNADRRDSLGVWRSASWYLRNSNTAGAAEISFQYGLSTDKPLVGDWR